MRDHLVDHDDWKRAEQEHVRKLRETDLRATELEALEEDVERMDESELRRLQRQFQRQIGSINDEIESLESDRRHKQSMLRIVSEALDD